MLKNINRISIIGGPGTGKSTLAKNLGKELNLPIYHIDGIHHLENWEVRDKKERDKIILEKIQEEKWIIDGTYRDTLKARVKSADMIIYLDYSSIAKLKGIIERYIYNKGKERPEIPGCRERLNLEFIKFTLKWTKNKREQINEILQKYGKTNKVIIFKNRRKLNKWYKKEFNKKIEV